MTGAPGGGRHGRRVLLDAKDPARRRELAVLLAESGHAVVDGTAPWEVALVDLAVGEEPPEVVGRRPLVLLTDHLDAEAGCGAAMVSVLPRNAPAGQVEAAVVAAAAGLVVRVPGAAASPAATVLGFARDDPGAPLLTPREVEILALLGDGASNKAVARRLGISAHTVKFHLEAVFRKLGVTTRAEAVARGLRQRLIEM
jgi:two-component system, NarL family, nitrate/nitrite response regulator NarL